MSLMRKLAQRKKRRAMRVRRVIKSSGLPRISVFRSTKHIYGQLINDVRGNTLASCSSLELTDIKGDKKEIAHAVGLELARRALDKGVDKAAFDRGSFLYHGRVRSFADGLRAGGIKI